MLHGSTWPWAIHLLNAMPCKTLRPDVVSESAAVATTPWQVALELQQGMRASKIRGNSVAELSLALSCRAQWPVSLLISETWVVHWQAALEARRSRPATTSVAQLDARQWSKALSILEHMRCWSRADFISLSAALKVLEKAAEWQRAMRMVCGLRGDEMLFGALIGACHRAERVAKAVLYVGIRSLERSRWPQVALA